MALANLPSELLILVQSFLTPLDILSLQLTNRTIRSRAFCRVVWRGASRRVIEENDIFGPTFDLATMSVEDLRYAALRPQFFLKRVKRGPRDAPHLGWPASQREIVLEIPYASQDTMLGLHLVQGGRFVLADFSQAFRVYSLEDRTDTAASLEPVLSMVKGEGHTLTRDCALGLHAVAGDEIVFFFSRHVNYVTSKPALLVAYKVTGLGSGSIRVDSVIFTLPWSEELRPLYCCAGDHRLAFVGCDSGIVSVWDYEQNQVAMMEIQDHDPSEYRSIGCVLTCNSLVIQTHRALLVYDIPPLAPLARPPARIIPQVSHPIRTYPTGRRKVRTTNQASVDFLDLHYTHGDGIFDRYRIERVSPNNPSSPFLPVMDSGGLELRPESGYDMTYCMVRAPRACMGNVFTMGYRTGWYDPDIEAQADRRDYYFSGDEWEPEDYTEEIDEAIGRENDQAGVFVHVEHRDQERDVDAPGRYPASVVELLDRSDAAWGQRQLSFVDFCPASGRLCAVFAGNGPPRLLVFDYLPASM